MSNKLLKKHYNGHCLYRVIPDPRYLTLETDGNGTLVANKTSGYSGDIISLTATPTAYSASFNRYEITGATLTSNDFAFQGEDVTAKAFFNIPIVRTLTLQTDGHGTLTADKITGYAGQTVTLTPTYNTYYRFKNYQNTGGSINGNTFTFTDADATAKANFSANAFTASGSFETGQYIDGSYTGRFQGNAGSSFALTSYHTNNVPASWYATSNRWNPSNASAYSITLNGCAGSGWADGFAGNGSTVTVKLFNNTTQVSSKAGACSGNFVNFYLSMQYNNSASNRQGYWYSTFSYNIAGQRTVPTRAKARAASGLNWTATGYAP